MKKILLAVVFSICGVANAQYIDLANNVQGILPILNGGTGVTLAQGTGTKVQMSTGTTTTGDCTKYDSAGNTVDAGFNCAAQVYPAAGVPNSTGTAWGASYAVGSGANNLPQLDAGGLLLAAILPNPSATTLGGIKSYSAVAHQFVTSISTAGVVSSAQPSFSDLSGSATSGQMPAFTGDATSSAGSTALTVVKINGTLLSGLTTGLMKNTTGTGVPSIAAAGTDYAPATSGSSVLKGNGAGGTTTATAGTDYVVPTGVVANLTGGTAGQQPYQSAPNVTAFTGPCLGGWVLGGHGTSNPDCALAIPYTGAAGTVDAITALYYPAITALSDGMTLAFVPTGANTSTTPTFSPNGLTAHTIVKNNGATLVAGDIAGTSARVLLQYNSLAAQWVLINPAVAANVTTNANLTGDVTSTGNAATVVKLNGTSLAGLTTGLMKITTGTGVPSTAVAGTDYPATGVVTAGGPTGSATVAPIITYNANGQITVMSSATITPAITNVTGLGTGVGTALAANVGSAGAPVVYNGAGGTPSSMTGTNITGTATGFTVGSANNMSGGSANNIPYQTATGVSGFITNVNNAVVVTNGSGVPSESTTLPSGLSTTNLVDTTPTIQGYIESPCTPTITAGAVTITITSAPSGCTTISTFQKLSLVANTSVTLPAPVAGTSYSLLVCASGAFSPTFTMASGTLSWFGTAPTPTATAGKCDLYSFTSHGTTYLFGSALLNATGS